MSRYRELTIARDNVLVMARIMREHVSDMFQTPVEYMPEPQRGFCEAVDEWDRAGADLDAAGGAGRNRNSVIAAKTTLPAKGSVRLAIIQVLVAQQRLIHTGMTISELKARLRKEHSTVSAALNYLVESGWVRDSGETRKSNHNKPAAVWVPTDKAIEKVTEMAMVMG